MGPIFRLMAWVQGRIMFLIIKRDGQEQGSANPDVTMASSAGVALLMVQSLGFRSGPCGIHSSSHFGVWVEYKHLTASVRMERHQIWYASR